MQRLGSTVIGVDVGGTFTDLFLFDAQSGRFQVAKVPSQRGDEALGFMGGLEALGGVAGVDAIVHGTTVGTNALLERKGAPVGIITTAGFRDVLDMRRRDRPKTWGLWGNFEPVSPRDLRVEVPERTLADGTILTPVDGAAVVAAARLLQARGAVAIAVIFINAYANTQNEQRAVAAVRSMWANEHVACSSELLPEIREFERASTTALNATLQPVVGDYLRRLSEALDAESFRGSFHIVQSNGGVMSTAMARRFPVRTALSGPAAGVIAASAIARAAGFEDVITGDLGGTSFDVALVAGGQVALAAQTSIDFGLVIRSPMIEITTIGAGGGSIARVDQGGLLEVGPESAGSRPGPACYGQGNDRPTLTDANLVLGRIDGEAPIGNLKRLDSERARTAIAQHVGEPLGLDVMAAAEAILRVANARMADAIRLVSIERGLDPACFKLMPFGGGGALHAGALIREVGLRGALVPRFPGVTSALGCVIADVRQDQVQTLNLMLDDLAMDALEARMLEAGTAVRSIVESAGLDLLDVAVSYEMDMHYLGQTHTVRVPLPMSVPNVAKGVRITGDLIRTAFETAYNAAFSRLLPGIPVRIVSLRTTAIGRRPAFDLRALAPGKSASMERAARGSRHVWFDGAWQTATRWSRLDLPVGAVIPGPAILEQPDATVLVDPGLTARVDAMGNVILQPREPG